MDITNNTQIGIGYEFSDLGKSELGAPRLSDFTNNRGLHLSHFYSQSLLLSISRIC